MFVPFQFLFPLLLLVHFSLILSLQAIFFSLWFGMDLFSVLSLPAFLSLPDDEQSFLTIPSVEFGMQQSTALFPLEWRVRIFLWFYLLLQF